MAGFVTGKSPFVKLIETGTGTLWCGKVSGRCGLLQDDIECKSDERMAHVSRSDRCGGTSGAGRRGHGADRRGARPTRADPPGRRAAARRGRDHRLDSAGPFAPGTIGAVRLHIAIATEGMER